MSLRRRRLRAMVVLVVGVGLTAIALGLSFWDPLRQVEVDTVDTRFAIRGTQPPPDDIVIVEIDDASLDELGLWPIPRSMHGRVIDELRRAGARTIAYDVQFTEPSGNDREDNALIRAVHRAGELVVLATTVVNERGEHNVFGGPGNLGGARVGNTFFPLDSDGVHRRVPYDVNRLTSLPVAVVETAERRSITTRGFTGGTRWIDYHGPPGAVPSVSFIEVLDKRIDRARLRDKIVIVGPTAPSLQDVHPTSASAEDPMSGAEIIANSISTLLRGQPLRETPAWVDAGLILALGMLAPLLNLCLRWPRGLLLSITLGLLYIVLVQLAFSVGLILPLVYPLIAIVASWIGVLVVEFATATHERERVRELFTRFVPEGVVSEVLAATDDDLRLVGKRLQSTVVFCDLRGFTAFAELRPAEDVIEALNHYLTEMSVAIRAHGGTLLSYVGDGILAVFGAPIEQTDHADRALAAVRDMAGGSLERYNRWLTESHAGEPFRIGIGVNSGVILCGNVGCEWRVEYTAVGDPVNTASRLQTMTKETPYQVLISDTTRAMLRENAPDLRYVDAIGLRGKKIKANLWTLDLPGPVDVAAAAPIASGATSPY